MKQLIDNEEQQPKGRSMKMINGTQAGILFRNNNELAQADAVGIIVEIDASCSSLTISAPGNLKVNTGNYLKMLETALPIMDDRRLLPKKRR